MKKLLLLIFASAAGLLAQAPTIGGVVNAELPTSSALCPGLAVSIYGTGFGSGSTSSVVVLVGGQKGFVTAVAPTQVNLQLPFNAPIGATTVVVTTGGGSSAPFNVTISSAAPSVAVQGATNAPDIYTLKNVLVTGSAPANPGDTLTLYATGLGQTSPAQTAAPGTAALTATLATMTVGGQPATVLFSGYGGAGVYQVNFTVPKTVQGSVPLILSIDGQASAAVTLPLFGISAITSGASFLNTDTAAPEEIISLFGNGLGSTNDLSGVFPSTSAQGVSVTFNGIAAPIFALAATGSQINLIVPAGLPTTGTV